MTAVLDFIDAAAVVLADHATFTWNKAMTRIRCNGQECGSILETPGGEEDAVHVFARHQAEQLPEPRLPVAPAAVIETETTPVPPSDQVPEPERATSVEADAAPSSDPEPAAGEPVEQVLSEAALAIADQTPAPKIRRDTKALTATIAEIKKGDRVSAGFNHPRYGYFTVEGTVIKGGTGLDRNQLMVGGWYINLNERAAKYLCELAIIAPAGQHEFIIPKPSEQTEHVGIGS